jgi:hypothetical protein
MPHVRRRIALGFPSAKDVADLIDHAYVVAPHRDLMLDDDPDPPRIGILDRGAVVRVDRFERIARVARIARIGRIARRGRVARCHVARRGVGRVGDDSRVFMCMLLEKSEVSLARAAHRQPEAEQHDVCRTHAAQDNGRPWRVPPADAIATVEPRNQ